MSKFKCDSYSGTDMIYKSKIVIHCSTYTYAELEEEYESGVIENPKEIEIIQIFLQKERSERYNRTT